MIEKAKRLADEGWKIRIRRIKRYLYLTARKSVGGRRQERSLGRVSPEELREIKHLIPTVSITTTRSSHKKRKTKKSERLGKGGRGFLSGLELLNILRIHRVGLRFSADGKQINVTALHGLGEVSYEPCSRQHIVRVGIGIKRVVTIQVNQDGSAQVFLECSDNPMDFFEFIGFCEFWLLEVFSKLTGTNISLKDFRVILPPEFNIDIPRVAMIEIAKCITLKDLCHKLIVRIYEVKQNEKVSMPEGGTRVEVVANNLQGENLKDFVKGIMSLALLPKELRKLKKDLKKIKVRLSSIENQVQALKSEGAIKLGVKKEIKKVTFEDLPEDLQRVLMELESLGYIRVREDRVEYGDRVWAAIKKYHGNIDGWIEWESQGLVGKMRGIFKNVIGAIRYYDNKYEGKPGVPYDKFLEAFELIHRKREQVDRYNAIP